MIRGLLVIISLLAILGFVVAWIEKRGTGRYSAGNIDVIQGYVALDPTFFPLIYLLLSIFFLLLPRRTFTNYDPKLSLIDLFIIMTMTALIFATQPVVTRIFGYLPS